MMIGSKDFEFDIAPETLAELIRADIAFEYEEMRWEDGGLE